jgi:hypothetical protein
MTTTNAVPARGSAQAILDRFFTQNGPCCAGCDWWHHHNSLAGECHRSAPVPGDQRAAMLGISYASISLGAGHVLTQRDHHCGEFVDTFDWSTLPAHYLRGIGRSVVRQAGTTTTSKEAP